MVLLRSSLSLSLKLHIFLHSHHQVLSGCYVFQAHSWPGSVYVLDLLKKKGYFWHMATQCRNDTRLETFNSSTNVNLQLHTVIITYFRQVHWYRACNSRLRSPNGTGVCFPWEFFSGWMGEKYVPGRNKGRFTHTYLSHSLLRQCKGQTNVA
jgi:hypothetical protein